MGKNKEELCKAPVSLHSISLENSDLIKYNLSLFTLYIYIYSLHYFGAFKWQNGCHFVNIRGLDGCEKKGFNTQGAGSFN